MSCGYGSSEMSPLLRAARWLNASGLLKDRASRPGLPLKNLLRAGAIDAAVQTPARSQGRWFIGRANRLRDDRARAASVELPLRATRRNNYEDEAKIRHGGGATTRANKAELLGRLRDLGIFLIDLWGDPVDARSDAPQVAGLVGRVRQPAPERIIVIKTGVFDLVRGPSQSVRSWAVPRSL